MVARLSGAVVVAVILSGGALAGGQAVLPFEQSAAYKVDSRSVLHFDDYAGKITDQRIKRLLRSGDILGDRVLLQNDVAVYFPDGHIVSAKAEFHTYRPVAGLFPWNVYSAVQVEPNPNYQYRSEFDALLGPACAETVYSKGSKRRPGESYARLRINRQNVLSLELDSPGLYDYLTGEPSRSYTVTSALDPYYLGDAQVVQQLMNTCIEYQRTAIEQAKAGDR
ncbi:MAG TPA: hypothetical protein VGB88_10525 [Alphaproteobacteria bacterium]